MHPPGFVGGNARIHDAVTQQRRDSRYLRYDLKRGPRRNGGDGSHAFGSARRKMERAASPAAVADNIVFNAGNAAIAFKIVKEITDVVWLPIGIRMAARNDRS